MIRDVLHQVKAILHCFPLSLCREVLLMFHLVFGVREYELF